MVKVGLKIWSINTESFPKLAILHNLGVIDYVEMYVVPNSFNPTELSVLRNVPIIFHAPTYNHNFNISERNEQFKVGIETLRQFKEYFNKNTVIFHTGFSADGSNIERTIENINMLKNEFDIILENMPHLGYKGDVILLAAHYTDFQILLNSTKVKFCLDISHSICAANYFHEDPVIFFNNFLAMRPVMFHVCDNDYKSRIDMHLNLLAGSIPLKRFLKKIPETAMVTLETPKSDFSQLSEDQMNLKVFNSLL